ncbi:MAG TPA: YbhB/YbcL family Raf kinase inhibitor-like protein [Rhodanobacteraceae bacterium]|nr:YbhB/YbcL family Raf kinase inhibitor-like protein [Rhodanobacteraceae bacterium]
MKQSLLVPLLAVFASAGVRADGFTLESASFGPNTTLATKHVYNKSECNGGNVSPELHWSGAPAGTKSFAVTMFDPDARGGVGWWHWLLFDIDAKTTSLEAGAGAAAGTSAKNDFGETGYGGPCPPRGDKPHHYVFTVYALGTEHLGVDANADAAAVKTALEANALLSTSLQALYGR